MSFGFSVGDFIAVGSIIANIVSSLKDSNGSSAEYRDLVRELQCLQKTLVHLDRLRLTGPSPNLESIKYAALSCRRPLEAFLARIQKYDPSLGVLSKPNPIKGTFDKIKFALNHKEDIRKLQTYLSVHVSAINILLTEHGLERMELATERSENEQMQIRQRLVDTRGVLDRIRTSVAGQTFAVFKTMLTLEKVYKILSGELQATWKVFEGMIAKVCVSTQQIYTVVLEIQTAITTPDVRWSHFQEPIVVEDALGRKFPFPSEFDYDHLDTILKHKFQNGPGSQEVALGDYEIMDGKDRSRILSSGSNLRPGCSVTMAILIGRPPASVLNDRDCPMPRCGSTRTKEALGGGRLCCECNVWFDESTRRRRSILDLWEAQSMIPVAELSDQVDRNPQQDRPKKRKRPLKADDARSVAFKNVKLAEDNPAIPRVTPFDNGDIARTPISPPTAYSEFLRFMSLNSPIVTGTSTTFAFSPTSAPSSASSSGATTKSLYSSRSARSPFDWEAALKARKFEGYAKQTATARYPVKRTVTYTPKNTPKMAPAPKGKRRKIE